MRKHKEEASAQAKLAPSRRPVDNPPRRQPPAITGPAIEAAADAIGEHEYRVDNTWVPSCTCGWTADAAYDIPAYDRHVAADALDAALPHIRATNA